MPIKQQRWADWQSYKGSKLRTYSYVLFLFCFSHVIWHTHNTVYLNIFPCIFFQFSNYNKFPLTLDSFSHYTLPSTSRALAYQIEEKLRNLEFLGEGTFLNQGIFLLFIYTYYPQTSHLLFIIRRPEKACGHQGLWGKLHLKSIEISKMGPGSIFQKMYSYRKCWNNLQTYSFWRKVT